MAEYIDWEELRTAMQHIYNDPTCPIHIAAEIEQIIDYAPAADVVPVRHGKWDGNDCTICKLPWNYNMTQDADDWGYFDPMPNYCPNCGAKMDEGNDNAAD